MSQTTVGRTSAMKTTRQSIIVVAILTTLWFAPSLALAEFPGKHPFPGITYQQETLKDPPMQLFIAEVNLTKPNVKVHVSRGGPDPDGPGEWETTLMEPTRVASREGFDLVVNGDFFKARNVEETDTFKPHYRADMWAAVVGPAVTDSRVWSTSKERTPCLVVRKDGRVIIEMIDTPSADAEEVIAGNILLVEKGKPISHENNKARFPRTVVGLNKKNTRLVIMVVDGRKPGVSIGMTLEELARKLVRLGCYAAFNLDGGGSSIMALRDPAAGKYRILNTPSTGRERAVANVLGVTVENEKKKYARVSDASKK